MGKNMETVYVIRPRVSDDPPKWVVPTPPDRICKRYPAFYDSPIGEASSLEAAKMLATKYDAAECVPKNRRAHVHYRFRDDPAFDFYGSDIAQHRIMDVQFSYGKWAKRGDRSEETHIKRAGDLVSLFTDASKRGDDLNKVDIGDARLGDLMDASSLCAISEQAWPGCIDINVPLAIARRQVSLTHEASRTLIDLAEVAATFKQEGCKGYREIREVGEMLGTNELHDAETVLASDSVSFVDDRVRIAVDNVIGWTLAKRPEYSLAIHYQDGPDLGPMSDNEEYEALQAIGAKAIEYAEHFGEEVLLAVGQGDELFWTTAEPGEERHEIWIKSNLDGGIRASLVSIPEDAICGHWSPEQAQEAGWPTPNAGLGECIYAVEAARSGDVRYFKEWNDVRARRYGPKLASSLSEDVQTMLNDMNRNDNHLVLRLCEQMAREKGHVVHITQAGRTDR